MGIVDVKNQKEFMSLIPHKIDLTLHFFMKVELF